MIPLATHIVDVLRETNPGYTIHGDPTATFSTIDSNVRAVINAPSGGDVDGSVPITATINLDPCGVQNNDVIRDKANGNMYRVLRAELKVGLGLDHIEGSITAYPNEMET